MNQDVKEKWIEALESGTYEQARNCLKSKDGAFCCLGVLCDLYLKSNESRSWSWRDDLGVFSLFGDTTILPTAVSKWAGLDSDNPMVFDKHKDDESIYQVTLSDLNDDGNDFKYIANVIKQNVLL